MWREEGWERTGHLFKQLVMFCKVSFLFHNYIWPGEKLQWTDRFCNVHRRSADMRRLAHLKTKSINSRIEGLALRASYALTNQPGQAQCLLPVNHHISVHEEAGWKLQFIEMVCSLWQAHPFFSNLKCLYLLISKVKIHIFWFCL